MLNLQSLITAIAGTILIGLGLSSNVSLAANLQVWNLTFFDNANNQVGSGQFSYDLDTTTLIESSCGFCDPSTYVPVRFSVRTALESFSATLNLINIFNGQPVQDTWTLNDPLTQRHLIQAWWDDPSVPVALGNLWYDEFNFDPDDLEVVEEGRWIFGDSRHEAYRYFEMGSAQRLSSTVWQGSWNVSDTIYSGGGTWRATNTAIPEPLTILGAGVAVGFGTAFKKRLAKEKS